MNVIYQLTLFLTIICVHLIHSENNGSNKVFHVTLDIDGNITAYWTLDYQRSVIKFEIHYPSTFAKWFAFGFSNYGEFAPADYCVLWTNWMNDVSFEDTWADKDGYLYKDKSQDCLNFRFVVKNGILKYVFERKFDTCDPNDYLVEEGTTHIVWVSGNDKLYDIERLNVLRSSHAHRNMVRVQLLKNININTNLGRDAWHIDVLANKVHVPSKDTTYWCHIQHLPESLTKKQHIVQFESKIQKGNEGLVHHMEVFHCEAPATDEIPNYQGDCFVSARPNKTQVCKKVLAAWAMGAPPFTYPEEAGSPIGGPNFNRYVMLEVHYNNPELRSDWIDSSGIRLWISPHLRKYDSGIMELGLEYTDKMAIPEKQTNFLLSGYCISECTAVGIPPDGIVIFGSQLHTHLTGVRVYTKHIRNGQELPELNRDNHYSTHFQEIRRLKNPVRILPGDALITTCEYNTMSRNNITLGGFAITDEMCVNYVHYYPTSKLEVCKSAISDEYLHKYFQFMRIYENQPTSDLNGISDNYKSIEWSPLRASVLEDYYSYAPLGMQCNMSGGDRFPGYWDNMLITQIHTPLPQVKRQCHDDTMDMEDLVNDLNIIKKQHNHHK